VGSDYTSGSGWLQSTSYSNTQCPEAEGDLWAYWDGDAWQSGGVEVKCPAASVASEAMAVSYGGYEYRTMMGNVPAAGNTELLCHGSTCRPLPDGYEIAPADPDVITNVIAAFTWSTHGEHAPVTSLLSLIAPHSVLPLWLRRSHGCLLELGH
jgi:hypothetical protein